jgi:pimeloyl-ACP methyl ester carboxylesterase
MMPTVDTFERDGLRFTVRDEGPRDAEVAVLLHGFPQGAASWDLVVPALHAGGLRTLVPNQRGYSPGARPVGVQHYRMAELVADVVALIERSGVPRVRLVGHDWGAGVAWTLATRRPDLVSSLTAVSVPHPAAFLASLRGSTQALRSWYMVMFQRPGLAERLLDPAVPATRTRFIRSLVRTGQSPERAERDAAALSEPGAYTAALSWYRAATLDGPSAYAGRVRVPTTLLWGARDSALGFDGVRRTTDVVDAPYRLQVIPGAGHWIPEDDPLSVAAACLDPPGPLPAGPPRPPGHGLRGQAP